ncbi:hypothetical protein HW555_007631 [Spodoptera exigua]|uniref:phosphoserine transaminase n=1 Tax=Spodoptera exigua TaxID=7107 RepID=A0A835GGQ3_SPOEX|nr:hypothetical protein HW555_007631 [Spodoptera exigua]
MSKIYNFGAGPAKMPEEVYEIMRKELTNFDGSGISLLETSHRTKAYMQFNTEVQNVVRRLLDVPANYKILFMAGGGTGEFAAVPLNLMSRTGTADYVVTGDWSAKAAKEAKKYGKVNMVLPPTDRYVGIPDQSEWNLDPNASYVHICTNETIHGVEFDFIPDTKGVPLVADMSSNIMSKKVDVSKEVGLASTAADEIILWHRRMGHLGVRNLMLLKNKMADGLRAPVNQAVPLPLTDVTVEYDRVSTHHEEPEIPEEPGNPALENVEVEDEVWESSDEGMKQILRMFGVIYAGAQKNIGTAGVCLVIVREDLLNQALPICPSLFDWTANAKADSILNTPPMFAIYVMGRVLQWVERNGGVEGMAKLAAKKASLVYGAVEESNGFYSVPVAKNARSKMNVPFRIGSPPNEDLEKEFLKGAEALGLIQLKGHRNVGGIRASIYNAVSVEEVETLVKYMKDFQNKYAK